MMDAMKADEISVGTKVRRWKGEQATDTFTNGDHCNKDASESLLTSAAQTIKISDITPVKVEALSKRSHSSIMKNGNQNEEADGSGKSLNEKKSTSKTSPQSCSSASSPKRHHPASPKNDTMVYDKASIECADQERPMEESSSSSFSVTSNSADSTPPEDSEQEKLTNAGCNMNEKTTLEVHLDDVRVGPSQITTSEGQNNASASVAKSNPSGPNIGCRNGSLLPRPTGAGSTPLSSSKSKTASRSKRHSSRTNLYIRGLPKSMSENDLVSLVPDASAIRSVKLVVNNDGEGYGFIDFISNEAALIAMQHIKHQNSNQYVNFAYESEKDPLNVYVTNIPESWNADNVENLKQIFAPYGKITSALVMTRRSTNTCTGTGFVRYVTSEEAQRAIDGIRKAKITLPGAKRPLELKLADRQRARESKSELVGSESNAVPLFQQFMREDPQQHLSQALKSQQQQQQQQQHHTQVMEDIFSTSDRNLFDQAKVAGYVTGPSLMSPNGAELTSTPSDDMPSMGPSQLAAPTVLPVSPAVAAATALATPLYQFPCLPWIHQDPTGAHGSPTAAYIHPHLAAAAAAAAASKATAATAPLDLSSLAAAYQMSGLSFLNYAATPAPPQSFDLILPLLNGQFNGSSIDASSLYQFGLNQSLWSKACFYGS